MEEENTNETEQFESVLRLDYAPIETKFDSTPEGFLQGQAIVTRVGVFTYRVPNGTIRKELRLPEDVFNEDSMETLKRKPISIEHQKGLLNPDTVAGTMIGSTGSNVTHDDNFLSVDLVIMDSKGIKDVKAGRRELSAGYRADTYAIPGVHPIYGEYTHIQKNIRFNHIAIVKKARAGSLARIRMDGALAPIDEELETKENGNMENMKTINLDSVDYQAEQQVIDALKKAEQSAEEYKVKMDSASATIASLEAERDAAKEKLDSVEKELEELKKVHVDSADVLKLVKERVALEGLAKELKIEFKEDSADAEIQKAIIMNAFPHVSTEKLDSDEVYFKTRYEIALEEIAQRKKAKEDASVRGVKMDAKEEPAPVEKKDSAKAYAKRIASAYKIKKEE